MPVIRFDINEVKRLVDDARAAKKHSPTMDMLFDEKYYIDNIIKNESGLSEKEVEEQGGHFWPSSKYIDASLVEPCLQIVGDQGVYLINNTDTKQTPIESGMIVYTQGMNTDTDEFWYEKKRSKF